MAGYYFERGARAPPTTCTPRRSCWSATAARRAGRLDLISTTRPMVERSRERSRGHRHPRRPRDDQRHARPHRPGARRPRAAARRSQGGQAESGRAYSARAARPKIAEAVRLAAARSGNRPRASARRARRATELQPPLPHAGRHRRLEPRQAQPEDRQAGRADRPGRGRSSSFESADRRPTKPIATYVNYAMHLDNVGGAAVLGRHPGRARALLAGVQGPGDGHALCQRRAAATSTTST